MSDVLTEDAKAKALGNAAGGPGGDSSRSLDPRRRRVQRLSPIEDAMP